MTSREDYMDLAEALMEAVCQEVQRGDGAATKQAMRDLIVAGDTNPTFIITLAAVYASVEIVELLDKKATSDVAVMGTDSDPETVLAAESVAWCVSGEDDHMDALVAAWEEADPNVTVRALLVLAQSVVVARQVHAAETN